MRIAIYESTFLIAIYFSLISTGNFTDSKNETYAASESAINESFYYDLNDTFSFNDTYSDDNITENATQNLEPSKTDEIIPEWTDDSTPTGSRIKDEDLCTCDLISTVCEVNCCCDPDCDDQDVKVFTECIPQYTAVDPKYCYKKDIFYKNNTFYKGFLDPDSHLFCIVRDNFKKRFRFNEVPSYEKSQDFQKLYKIDSYSWNFQSENNSFNETLKAGSPLFLRLASGHIQPWSIPFHCFSKACDCHQPVNYLEDVTSSCLIIIKNLSTECQKNTRLSAEHYIDFCIKSFVTSNTSQVLELKGIEEFNQTDNIENKEYVQNDDSKCLIKNDFYKPSFHKYYKTCNNIVTSVQYVIVHSGIDGIQNIGVNFEYGKIDSSNSTFFQKFSVTFLWNDTNPEITFKRSGNPGYQMGLPLIAGRRFNASDKMSGDSFVKIVSSGLTILNSYSSGSCNGVRKTLNFGQNVQTGCIFKTKIQSCNKTQKQIMNILLGERVLERANFIASFGNPNINKSNDWIEIFLDGSNPNDRESSTGDCNECNLILGYDIDIAYAAVGSSANPQFKVVGIVFRNHSKVPVYCTSIETSLHLSTSVNFFDVSELAVPVFKNIPVFNAKLPQDFFYPFLLSNAYHHQCNNVLRTLVLFVMYLYSHIFVQ